MAILVVTHDINRAVVCADTIIAMRDGLIVREGPPGEIATTDVLEEIYGSEFLLTPHPDNGRPMVVPRSGGREESQ